MNAVMEIESGQTSDLSRGRSGLVETTPQAASASSGERRVLVIGDGDAVDKKRTLVIGDLHGHLDRLEALLRQEGLLGWCERCEGIGEYEIGEPDEHGDRDRVDCSACEGEGIARLKRDEVEVVLLGDLGHFGKTGSPTGDVLTWHFANKWADVILWGNHDRAMVDSTHAFNGFHRYPADAFDEFDIARAEGRLKLAHATHGFLLTHAGLCDRFRYQKVDDAIKDDPYAFADWINQIEDPQQPVEDPEALAVRDAIGRRRGGPSPAGGILWRDIDESLYIGFRQVFGHSADHARHAVRFCWRKGSTRIRSAVPAIVGDPSYCVDVGGKGDKPGDNCVAAIYLPDETIVRVDLDKEK